MTTRGRSASEAKQDSRSNNRDSTDTTKRRKQQQADAQVKSNTQPTISELFASRKPTVKSCTVPSNGNGKLASRSPPSKRQKLEHPTSPVSVASERLSPRNMYHFGASRARTSGSNVIDLTGSPDASPKKLPARTRPNLNPELGPKKILVKNLRTAPKTDSRAFFNATSAKVDKSLDAIFGNEALPFSLEELYKGVEYVCRQGHAAELHGRLEAAAKSHANNGIKGSLLKDIDSSNIELLNAAVRSWTVWTEQMDAIRGIFFYMDRAYLLPLKKPSISDMGMSLFKSIIFNDKQIQPKVVGGICDFITADRNGQATDQELARTAMSMFHTMGVYTHVVEPKLLQQAQSFVSEWSAKAVAEKDLATYLRDADTLMTAEIGRCDVLGINLKSTKRDLLALLEHHLIERQEDFLLNKDSVADLLDQNAVADLERLYSLLQRKQLGEKLRGPFEDWIDVTGTDIVFDEKEQDNMVVRLLTMKNQLDNLWRSAFHRNTEIGHGLRKAFDIFINKTKKTSGTWGTDNSKPGEMIAKYVDMLLRGGSKVIPASLTKNAFKAKEEVEEDNEDVDEERQVDEQLEQVLDLFRFVHGKAVFEAFYKKDLARRLLMGRSASNDAERSMLTRLKTECGGAFTQNLEQMFKDIELGREEMSSYKHYLTDREAEPHVDLNVNILSASAWPSYPDIKVNLPRQVLTEIERFERHYKSKHSGRRLEWKHALAHCQVRANFPKGRKEVIVSSFQAIVLLLFNGVPEDEHLSYERMLAETGLPEKELKRTLQSLACAKLRPLRKHPQGREINATDTFTLNPSFSHEKYRIKINQVQLKETREENRETHERVFEDRNFETQAAIVRIMKTKKTVSHNLLVAEVIEATRKRGPLEVRDIKSNIDRLIEKEYMEREEGNMYSYVA